MKRMIAALLGLALLLLASAQADGRKTMRLVDVWPTRAYQRAHPEIDFKSVAYDSFSDGLAQFKGKNAPDVMLMRLNNDNFAEFRDAGVLADLSKSEAISREVARMVPAVRDLVTTEDGRILGLPWRHLVRPVYWIEDAWNTAGLQKEDVPQSYTELLDFLEAWVARVEESPEKNVCVSRLLRWDTGTEKYNYCNWLMEFLLLSWELQLRCAGEAVTFDTPEFIDLAERTRAIGLALYEAEPRQKKRQNMQELFRSDLRGGVPASMEHGLSHTIPLRITSDQPMLTQTMTEILFVRADSACMEEAIAVIEADFLGRNGWERAYSLYADFAAGTYTGGVQDYTFTEGWLTDLREYEGKFAYEPSVFNQTRSGLTDKERLMMRFFEGKITAEEFAGGLI